MPTHFPALPPAVRRTLEKRVRSRRARAEDARRARLILMLAEGASYSAVCQALEVYPPYVQRWKSRFETHGINGLGSLYRGRKATVVTPKLEARILARTIKPPPSGATHWSTRSLGKALGVTHMTVARVWRRHGLKPHRLDRYILSDDPLFEEKAADILGLYLNPPAHAAVFSVDEKSGIQALDRMDPVLPLSPGRAERHGFEYHRHGTLSLFAAFNTKSGKVLGRTVPRHTSAAFVGFLDENVASQPKGKEIHVILDNLRTHKTPLVQEFLLEHPRVSLHYTPTYSSWLNQVELWFAKIERDVIARGIFTSVPDLRRKLMRYIHRYNDAPRPIRWVYNDPTYHISPATISRVTAH